MDLSKMDHMIKKYLNRLSIHKPSIPGRLLIVINELDRYTHTFVRAHVRDLTSNPYILTYRNNRKVILRNEVEFDVKSLDSFFHRFIWIWKYNNMKYEDYLVGIYLLRERIHDVLAEFATEGLQVMGSIHVSKCKFHIFFRGYDVFRDFPIERSGNYYPVLFQMADTCFCVSKEIRTYLLTKGCPDEKLIWAPSGADHDFFKTTEPRFEKPIFLYYGRFVAKKAPHMIVLAMKIVIERHPDARLIMAGSGELEAICRTLADHLGMNEQIHFLGEQSQQSILDILPTCTAYVQHSMVADDGDREGTPNSVMEAAAAGLPVIATRHGGITDVVVEGMTGFLVDEGDYEAMAERMCELLEDPEKCRKMGTSAREMAKSQFSKAIHNQIVRSRITIAG